MLSLLITKEELFPEELMTVNLQRLNMPILIDWHQRLVVILTLKCLMILFGELTLGEEFLLTICMIWGLMTGKWLLLEVIKVLNLQKTILITGAQYLIFRRQWLLSQVQTR